MEKISTIGLDIAKNVFQVHGIDEDGTVVVRRQVKRKQLVAFFSDLQPCLVGMEACATAHHWARELVKLGHEVRLMPPRYVKPYVKRNKNDMADAEAICEAVTRPTMRFVAIKTAEHQSVLMLHKTSKISFGGMWVFPGGRIDPEDHPEDGDMDQAARNAAARETREEAGLVSAPENFIYFSHWTPPPSTPTSVWGITSAS